MTTVYIIRHALAEGNLYRRCHGWYNSLITPEGYQQIAALEKRFSSVSVDAVYSSDLYRTMTTAQSICRSRQLPLRLSPALREVGMGVWEDLTWGDALHLDRNCMSGFLRCDPTWQLEGAETFPDAQERFCTAVEQIARSHPDQTVALFAHGAVIRIAFARWMGLPLEQISQVPLGNNTYVSCLEIENNTVSIRFYADDSHLTGIGSGERRPSSGDGLTRMEEASVYFRPFDLPNRSELYLSWREDGWMASHGTMDGFDGDAFLNSAMRNYRHDPNSIMLAYIKDFPVGMLQLDPEQEREFGVGRVPFLYVRPEYRSRGCGIQMLGHAVYTFRHMGRSRLRLRCAPENGAARRFYDRIGFRKVGEEPGGIGHLDSLELYIGLQLK